jgi:hypothetical protein
MRFAISAIRCGLVKGIHAVKWERRILFSANRYSFCSKSCSFTNPVVSANRRATCVFFIEAHYRSSLIFCAFG